MSLFGKLFNKPQDEVQEGTVSLFWGPLDRCPLKQSKEYTFHKEIKNNSEKKERFERAKEIIQYNITTGWDFPTIDSDVQSPVFMALYHINKLKIKYGHEPDITKRVSMKKESYRLPFNICVNKGYAYIQDPKSKLAYLKLDQLKTILECNNISPKGKKDELIENVIKNVPEEKYRLYTDKIESLYCITETGLKLLNKYPEITSYFDDAFNPLDANQVIMLFNKYGKNVNDSTEKLLLDYCEYLYGLFNYAEYFNKLQLLARFYIYKDKKKACWTIAHAMATSVYLKNPKAWETTARQLYERTDITKEEMIENILHEMSYGTTVKQLNPESIKCAINSFYDKKTK